MHQALHIFKKDVRYLRIEIAFLLALPAILVWAATRKTVGFSLIAASDILELLAGVAIAYVLTRLIHAESIPGENQFWLTRPYRWKSLLIAKLLFILAFINLPFLLVQATILIEQGFSLPAILPGLLWAQFLLLFAVALPLAALSAMTTGIVQYLAAILVIALIGIIVANQRSWGTPLALEWLRDTILLVTLLLAVPPVLYLQYRYRRTAVSCTLAIGIAVAGIIAYTVTPWPALFAAQSRLSKQPVDLQIGRPVATFSGSPLALKPFPLPLTGIPPGTDVQIESFSATLLASDGQSLSLSLEPHYDDPGQIWLTLDRRQYGAYFHAGQRLTLRATFYFTVFGNSRDKDILLTPRPTDVMDRLRCFSGFANQLVCIAPFRWPSLLVAQKTSSGALSTFTRLISYSPFPSGLSLNPVVGNGLVYYSGKPQPAERPVTINVKEPVAFIRRDVEFRDLPVVSRGTDFRR